MSHATFFVQSVARSTTALTLMRTGLRREEQLTATFWWCLPSFSSNTLCSLSSGCTCLTCSFAHIDLCPASSTTVQAMQSWGKSSSCTLRPHRQHTSLHKCGCAHAWKWWSSVSVTKQGRYISLDTVHAWQYHMQVDNMHPYSAHVREHARPRLPSHVSFSPLLSLSPVSTINSLAVHVRSPQTQQFLHIIWDHSHTNAHHVMLYIGSPKKNKVPPFVILYLQSVVGLEGLICPSLILYQTRFEHCMTIKIGNWRNSTSIFVYITALWLLPLLVACSIFLFPPMTVMVPHTTKFTAKFTIVLALSDLSMVLFLCSVSFTYMTIMMHWLFKMD